MYKKNTEHQIMVNTMKEGDHVVHSSDEEQHSPREKKYSVKFAGKRQSRTGDVDQKNKIL